MSGKLFAAFVMTLLLSGCILDDVTGPSGTPVDFTEVDSGQYSKLSYPADNYTFSDNVAFGAFYNELVCSMFAPCTVPDVDFSTKMVLAVVMGERTSGGYSIDIKEILVKGGALTVVVKSRSPAPGEIVTLALTNPYDIVSIDRTELPIGFYYE